MKYFLILIILFTAFTIYGQELSDFEKYKQKRDAEYNKYKSDRDKAFAKYIAERWTEFNLYSEQIADNTPKPILIPTLKTPKEGTPINLPFIKPKEITIPDQGILPVFEPVNIVNPQYVLNIDFYGINLPIELKNEFVIPEYNAELGKQSIANFWEAMGDSNTVVLISKIANYKKEFQLNDYAVYLLAKATANNFTNSTVNQQNLTVWYLMNKLGYKCRVANDSENNISLLLAINTTVYNTKYISVKGLKYYYMNSNSKNSISTYDKDFNENGNAVNLYFANEIKLPKNAIFNRTLKLNYGEEYSFNIQINQALIDLYSDFPQCDISVHFNEQIPLSVKENLYPQLKIAMEEMSQSEKAEFLLRFTQTVFKYQTDGEQFNKENYLFFAETLYYPYSDCEDRSIFYTHLIRDLLNIEVIGLNYPGHIATAIEDIMDNNQNSYFNYDNKRFIIADPTYINANVGVCMPKYINTKAEFILVK